MVYDSMHGVAGPFARKVFGDILGMDVKEVCMNSIPKEDFGGGHPDPNLTYAHDLVEKMGVGEHVPEDESKARNRNSSFLDKLTYALGLMIPLA
eukprot:382355-Amorphochlora_amoeboformis.AAC.1